MKPAGCCLASLLGLERRTLDPKFSEGVELGSSHFATGGGCKVTAARRSLCSPFCIAHAAVTLQLFCNSKVDPCVYILFGRRTRVKHAVVSNAEEPCNPSWSMRLASLPPKSTSIKRIFRSVWIGRRHPHAPPPHIRAMRICKLLCTPITRLEDE